MLEEKSCREALALLAAEQNELMAQDEKLRKLREEVRARMDELRRVVPKAKATGAQRDTDAKAMTYC